MLSAASYPVVLFGGVHLPAILAQSHSLHTLLWNAHFYLAFVFFALCLATLTIPSGEMERKQEKKMASQLVRP